MSEDTRQTTVALREHWCLQVRATAPRSAERTAALQAMAEACDLSIGQCYALVQRFVEKGRTGLERREHGAKGRALALPPAQVNDWIAWATDLRRAHWPVQTRINEYRAHIQRSQGREVECSVLGNEYPEASVVGEIVPDREFYDYDSKYASSSATELRIPAPITESAAKDVRDLALRMYRVMGCEGYARVDFFLTSGDRVVANEVNTIPGFTSISMYPKLWEASGLSYTPLLTRILEFAFERHDRWSRR